MTLAQQMPLREIGRMTTKKDAIAGGARADGEWLEEPGIHMNVISAGKLSTMTYALHYRLRMVGASMIAS